MANKNIDNTNKNLKKKTVKKKTNKKKEPILIRTNISYLILSVFLIGLGLFNLIFPYIGMEDILFYTSMIFLLYAGVTLACYMWSRKEEDYELLLLTITSVIISVFLFLCREGDVQVILGSAILAFYFQSFGLRLNKIILLHKKKDVVFYARLTTGVLLTILTLLVVYNLYTGTTVQTFIFGFYFIVYGIIWILDSVLYKLVKNDKFKKFLNSK